MRIFTEGEGFRRRRFLEVESERVSWLHLLDHRVRIGPAAVRAGCIAGVGTHHRHRRKGYSRLLMEDTTRSMLDEGFDVALLFGIEHFYHKFGYASCMPDVTATVPTRELERAIAPGRTGQPRFSARPSTDGDLGPIVDLYNENNSRRPLSVVRTQECFAGFDQGSGFHREPEVIVLEDASGAFAGYAVCDALPARTTVAEVEVKDPAALGAVLAEVLRTAVERRDGEVTFRLPADHLMVHVLRRIGCVVKVEHRNTGGAMGRIINQDSLLGKLVEAYSGERGAGASGLLEIEVRTELGVTEVAVPAARSGRGTLVIPHAALFQAVTGFRKAREVAISPGVEIAGEGGALLEFLEPEQEPHMYGPDHF